MNTTVPFAIIKSCFGVDKLRYKKRMIYTTTIKQEVEEACKGISNERKIFDKQCLHGALRAMFNAEDFLLQQLQYRLKVVPGFIKMLQRYIMKEGTHFSKIKCLLKLGIGITYHGL